MSRLNSNNTNTNSTMEQSSLFAPNIERNSLLRVAHYTLHDVEFVEELGEGAFGT